MFKILVIEDEKAIARALELKLKKAGFDAKRVSNGKEGIDILEEEKYDLILLDLVMPIMDGFATLKELKKRNIKTPVIILSNLSQESDEKKARELGAKDFFIKSNTQISFIVDKVKQFIDKKN